ncbi:MAG: TonB-dependent receptor, partial [Bacteroidales bacterium]|nr:TonB-dependent receptor [Bacteroidales bacterium]
DLSIVMTYQILPKLNFSASWIYYTGDAVTFPVGKYYIDGVLVNLYSTRNADRMPDYHRLDLGLTWNIKDTKKFSSDLNVSVYNAYNRKNAYSITFNESNSGQTEAERLALFGAVPSITWSFKFK